MGFDKDLLAREFRSGQSAATRGYRETTLAHLLDEPTAGSGIVFSVESSPAA